MEKGDQQPRGAAAAVQVARMLARLSATAGEALVDREQIRTAITRIENAAHPSEAAPRRGHEHEEEMEVVRKHAAELDAEIRRALIDLATALTAA